MARRRVKKRTHVGARPPPPGSKPNPLERTPKSMVIRIGAGEVGPSISQLVKDTRQIMEPGTASRLKERKSNKLRDYTSMAGPLGVSHLLLFSRSENGNTNLRLAVTPKGPTLHFRVERYSLCKDIQRAQRHYRSAGYEFQTPPLLVMNNFSTVKAREEGLQESREDAILRQLEGTTTAIFQGLFPPINPSRTPLTSVRRVLLLNREPPGKEENGTFTINVRHFAITTKVTGLPKAIRRLNAAEKLMTSREKKGKALPNLGRLEDVADYLLDPTAGGYQTGSDSEVETDAEVEVLQDATRKVLNKRDRQRAAEREGHKPNRTSNGDVEKRSVKLVELGPRMKLRMTKVEEGLCGGKVMWHEYIIKTKEEISKLDKDWEKRRQEKAERKRIQKENIEKKRKERKATGDGGEEEEDEDYDMDDYDSEGLDNDAEPDAEGNYEMEDADGGPEEDEEDEEFDED